MAPPPSTGTSPTNLRAAWRLATIASGSLAFAILLGAFGAHGLRDLLPPERLGAFETASRYHFYSCFVLFCLVLMRLQLRDSPTPRALGWAQRCWGWGSIVFCGSVYLVSVRGIVGLESASWLGAIAPIGGLMLISAACLLAYSCWRTAKETLV